MTKDELEFAENGDRMMYETIAEQRQEIESLTKEVQRLKREIVDRDCTITELKDNFKIAKDNEYEYSSLLTKAKELLTKVMKNTWGIDYLVVDEINEFLKVGGRAHGRSRGHRGSHSIYTGSTYPGRTHDWVHDDFRGKEKGRTILK